MIEKAFAIVVLVVCLALLVRMVLPSAQRQRLDRAGHRVWWQIRHGWNRLRHWRRVRRADAAREAREAIERASRKRTLH